MWATGWEEKANEYLPFILGLPFRELPVLTFDGRAVFGSAHWKLDAIEEYAAGRPAAWIDDNLDDECRAWAQRREEPTLLIQTESPVGDARGARGRAAGVGGCDDARMVHLNLADLEFEYDDTDPEGYRAGRVKVARGTPKRTGTSVWELPPGQAMCPYHYEIGEEEWLLVLDGRAHAANARRASGSCAAGPRLLPDRPRAERTRSETRPTTTVRALMWSEVVYPTATVYPDSDKIGIWTDAEKSDDVIVRRSSGVEYFDGET